MKYFIYLLLLVFVAGCNNTHDNDPSLQELEIVSIIEYDNGEIEFEVIGEVRSFSKGARDLETALEKTLNLDEKILNGCLVFEENFPEFFGFFILDTRSGVDQSQIKFHEKAKVKLRRFKLKTPILESVRKQKNIEYLYLVVDVQSLE